MKRPVAGIFGFEGTELTKAEQKLFRKMNPFGFILFKRNCDSIQQVRRLTDQLREITKGSDLLVLIDQEGGRVQRLTSPVWRESPPAGEFGSMAKENLVAAKRAVWINARLIAEDLRAIGCNINCVPCLDILDSGGDKVIGDRAFSSDKNVVVELARAQVDGLAAGGVFSIMKHIPGHGRAGKDSHRHLPVIDTSIEKLVSRDFFPFKALRHLPMAMTGHVIYSAIDPQNPATHSKTLISKIVRGHMNFEGILITDDICMNALTGSSTQRARRALLAGCDVVLHCNGNLEEIKELSSILPEISEKVNNNWLNCNSIYELKAGRENLEELSFEFDKLLSYFKSMS